MFRKSKEFLNFMMKIDLELVLRINPSIRKYNYDAYSSVIDKLNHLFYEATESKAPAKYS
jgi:hypothetical protein